MKFNEFTKKATKIKEDTVIHRVDQENPMDNTEVLVLGGAGRYSLRGLREKARREASELSDQLVSDHASAFRDAARHVKQLSNTLDSIVAAYDQLNKIRARGGASSRGIRKEDSAPMEEAVERGPGSPYDRGGADAWYHRGRRPHKIVDGREIKLTDPAEIADYNQGYDDEGIEGRHHGKQYDEPRRRFHSDDY